MSRTQIAFNSGDLRITGNHHVKTLPGQCNKIGFPECRLITNPNRGSLLDLTLSPSLLNFVTMCDTSPMSSYVACRSLRSW